MLKLQVKRREMLFGEQAPFDSCHAATVEALPGGELVAAWFAGTREGADDVAIWSARRTADGWTEPVKVADEEGEPHWNPVLFRDTDGTVWLFYKVGKEICSWRTMVLQSEDGGRSWSAPRILVPGDEGGRGPVKNKPILLHDGSWLAPASVEQDDWEAFADRSTDNGRTWQASAKITLAPDEQEQSPPPAAPAADGAVPPVPEASFLGKGVIQPSVWESAPGIVHMLLRSSTGFACRSDSTDGGRTWSPPYRTALPNNNSGIDLARMANGLLGLVYNPVGKNWGKRTPLVISFSSDNGIEWGDTMVLEDGPGEYSYPSIIADGSRLHLVYTWRRTQIAYWEIEVAP